MMRDEPHFILLVGEFSLHNEYPNHVHIVLRVGQGH